MLSKDENSTSYLTKNNDSFQKSISVYLLYWILKLVCFLGQTQIKKFRIVKVIPGKLFGPFTVNKLFQTMRGAFGNLLWKQAPSDILGMKKRVFLSGRIWPSKHILQTTGGR